MLVHCSCFFRIGFRTKINGVAYIRVFFLSQLTNVPVQ